MNRLILDTTAYMLGGADQALPAYTHLYSTFQFIATAEVAEGAGAQFKVQCAGHSETNFCEPDEFVELPEVAVCGSGAVPANKSVIAIPGPIETGQICKVAVPCSCAFLRVLPAGVDDIDPNYPSGAEASFSVVGLLSKPK